jgi:hypothetical protein
MNREQILPNPFATRFTRPGQLAWRSETHSPAIVLDRLEQLGGQGIICGPHGSGKSTLLRHLMVEADSRGWPTRMLRLRSWVDWPQAMAAVLTRRAGDELLCIDSWEVLAGPRGLLARLACQQPGRLIVTTHQAYGCGEWPVLWESRPEKQQFYELVAILLGQSKSLSIEFDHTLLATVFTRHGGNIREAFFELYDLYERQRRAPAVA